MSNLSLEYCNVKNNIKKALKETTGYYPFEKDEELSIEHMLKNGVYIYKVLKKLGFNAVRAQSESSYLTEYLEYGEPPNMKTLVDNRYLILYVIAGYQVFDIHPLFLHIDGASPEEVIEFLLNHVSE